MRIRFPVASCLFVIFILVVSQSGAAENASLNAALSSITADELRSHVDVLADDSFEGREAGSRGGRAAGVYLAQYLEKKGLLPAGLDGTYFQSFGSGYRNIIGYLEGSDPELKHEYIVVGAHYDHVGYGKRSNSFGPFGYVHNGADDNASGVAGLLEVLDALTSLPEAPKRSIIFGLWDGEEKGLLGSKYWVESPTISLQDVVFAINVDMIGRLRDQRLEVYGSRSGLGLRRLLSETNRDTEFSLDFTWEMKSNSDHYSFFAANLPVLMFHTGLHDDYHRPSDDAHLVNSDGMQAVARFLFNTTYELANRNEIARFRAESEGETPSHQRQLEAPVGAAPPRLGVRWQTPEGGDETGLLLTEIEPGSAADLAGLVVGDRLIRFAGKEMGDSNAFRRAVLAAVSPVAVKVARDPEAEPIELSVTLSGKPSRIGISWREDVGEPGTVILTRVHPGSAADQAGLQTGDRIYQISGASFTTTQDLFESLTTLPGPIDLLVERDGQLRTVQLEVEEQGT